jgi:hypothetical protein
MRGPRRARRSTSGALLALLLAASVAGAAEGPTAELKERTLVLSALPAVLARPEVRPHLQTGLTTTLLFTINAVDGGGRKAKGGGKVDIRYEPWDEVFLASAQGIDGRVRRETLPSFDRLLAWWRGLELPVLAAEPLATGAPWQIQVHLSVLPFSQSEEREAQRWLADSIERPSGGNAAPPAGRAEPLSGVLDALLATSIKRRSLVGYDWTLVLQAERRR